MGLRIASAFAVAVWVLAALIVLGRAGFQVSPLSPAFVRWGTWILVGVLPLGPHELRLTEQLGTLGLGTGRADPGDAMPRDRA